MEILTRITKRNSKKHHDGNYLQGYFRYSSAGYFTRLLTSTFMLMQAQGTKGVDDDTADGFSEVCGAYY